MSTGSIRKVNWVCPMPPCLEHLLRIVTIQEGSAIRLFWSNRMQWMRDYRKSILNQRCFLCRMIGRKSGHPMVRFIILSKRGIGSLLFDQTFARLVTERSAQHGTIHGRNIMRHFNPIARHFRYPMVLLKPMIPRAMCITLIIKIKKLIGKIHDLVSSFTQLETHRFSK